MKREFFQRFLGYFPYSRQWFRTLRLRNNPLVKGTIVDIETTGLNPGRGDYYNPQSHIITLGTYSGPTIELRQLMSPKYEAFRDLCVRTVEKKPKPLHAYFAHFEKDFLGIEQGWNDLGQYWPSDWHDGYRRVSLIEATRRPYQSREDEDVDGKDVPQLWAAWVKESRIKNLAEIAYHCYIDLLRESQLVNKT